MGPSPAASVRSWSDEEYDPNLDTAQKGTLGASNDEDHDYDPMAQNFSLTKSLTLATTLRETRDKKKQRPVVEVVTLNNTLASMHEDEVAFFTEEALGDDSAEDERTSKNDQKNASVFSLAEKQKGKEEGQRIRAEMKNMRSEPGTNDVRRTRVDDLGDFADESEWVPHIVSNGGGSVAWFKSWAAMTETEKRVADAEADRAEGISGIKGVVRAVVATSEDFGMGKNIKVERPSGADFERVLRVVQRSERKVGVLDDDTKKNVEDHLGSNPAETRHELGRRPGIRAVGRRVQTSDALRKEGAGRNAEQAYVYTAKDAFPVGGVRAKRGLPHEPPNLRGTARVVMRSMAFDVQTDEVVERQGDDYDADRRPDASDLVVVNEETTTTTKTHRETTSKTVTMDERGNVVDEGESFVAKKSVSTADANGNGAILPETAEDEDTYDAMRLTDGQVDIVAELLREKHGVEVTADELREVLRKIKTKKKYYGVDAEAWEDKTEEDDENDEEDEGITGMVSSLLNSLFAQETPAPPLPKPRFSKNVVFDKKLDPVIEARLAASSGLLARRDAKPHASRGAWRAAARCTDLGASADPRGDSLCTAAMTALQRKHVIEGEKKASTANAVTLRNLSTSGNKWRIAGAFASFVATANEAARVGNEYREEERLEYELPAPKPKPKPQPTQQRITQRRKLIDSKGNVVEVGETETRVIEPSDTKFESMADMIKRRTAKDKAEGRPRCICYDNAREPVTSGGGTVFRMGARRKRTTLAKTVKNCPVHFPFVERGQKSVPSKTPAKTHAAVDNKRGDGAVRDDDAGYVLYETSQYFYLASHDHTRLKWRLAKISRRAYGLEIDEHSAVYDRTQLMDLMSAVHKGNDATGGLRVVTHGAGVVALVELAANGGDDPAAASQSGPEAVITRAETLHRERVKTLAEKNKRGLAALESAESAHSGGTKGFTKTAAVVFSGVATQSVRRKGRVRTFLVGTAKSSRETEIDETVHVLSGGVASSELTLHETTTGTMPGTKMTAMTGKTPKHPDDACVVLDPGESATFGLLRLHRLTIGHASSQEPEHRLRIGKAAIELAKRESQRFAKEALAAKEEADFVKKEPSYFARLKTKAYRGCSDFSNSAFFSIFGRDALREDEAFFERRRRILRDRERPTVAELRAARLHSVDMKLLEQPDEIVEDGPLTELSDWFGNDWWFWTKDAEEENFKLDHTQTPEEASQRRRDPVLVKLRFRQYAEHDDAAK